MARRKHILHEYATEQVKKSFGRIRSRNKQQDQSRTTSAKVSTIFLLLHDRYIVVFDADNPIMIERKKKEK